MSEKFYQITRHHSPKDIQVQYNLYPPPKTCYSKWRHDTKSEDRKSNRVTGKYMSVLPPVGKKKVKLSL
jgi:hypothetical protein